MEKISDGFFETLKIKLEYHKQSEKEQADLMNYTKALFHKTHAESVFNIIISSGRRDQLK